MQLLYSHPINLTQISLLNGTPVEICAIGLRPSLTNFYTYFGKK